MENGNGRLVRWVLGIVVGILLLVSGALASDKMSAVNRTIDTAVELKVQYKEIIERLDRIERQTRGK